LLFVGLQKETKMVKACALNKSSKRFIECFNRTFHIDIIALILRGPVSAWRKYRKIFEKKMNFPKDTV
jgi:hypothetical protein